MKILEHEEQWTRRRQVLDRPRHCLEEANIVFGGRGLALRRAELGKQATQFGAPRRVQALDEPGHDVSASEGVDPGTER